MKAFTNLEQSKKLAKILPLESADMCYLSEESLFPKVNYNGMVFFNSEEEKPSTIIPCWSLAALLDVLPVIIGELLSENALRLRIDKSETDFNVWYDNLDSGMVEEGLDIIESNLVDACYEMILKLNEFKML